MPVFSGGADAVVSGSVTVSPQPLPVDGSGVTQPVSAATLPLPAGAAKDATLTDGSQRVGGTVTVDGSGHTQPVSATQLPLPSGAAQDATLTSGALRVGGTVVVDGSGVIQPVSGTVAVANFPASQPVTVTSLPLPSGAATDATLQAIRSAANETAWQAILRGEEAIFQ